MRGREYATLTIPDAEAPIQPPNASRSNGMWSGIEPLASLKVWCSRHLRWRAGMVRRFPLKKPAFRTDCLRPSSCTKLTSSQPVKQGRAVSSQPYRLTPLLKQTCISQNCTVAPASLLKYEPRMIPNRNHTALYYTDDPTGCRTARLVPTLIILEM